MRINTNLNRLDLTNGERAILEKADDLTRVIAKHGDGAVKEEANKAGFHLERLRRALGLSIAVKAPEPQVESKAG